MTPISIAVLKKKKTGCAQFQGGVRFSCAEAAPLLLTRRVAEAFWRKEAALQALGIPEGGPHLNIVTHPPGFSQQGSSSPAPDLLYFLAHLTWADGSSRRWQTSRGHLEKNV